MSAGGIFFAIKEFFLDVRSEIAKVTWPSREEFVGHLVVVLIAVFVAAIIFGIMDSFSNLALSKIFS